MAYDEALAGRVRRMLPGATERRMFGGIGLMERGNLVAGVSHDDLVVRVPSEETARWLREPGAQPMGSGHAMKGWVKVSADAVSTDARLARWVDRSRALAKTLPAK